MKKINFKKPKYIIPAISIIPVLWIGYQICSLVSFEVKDDSTVITEEVNTDLPTVDLEKVQIKSKYQSMLDGYGKVTDYTGVENVEKEEQEHGDIQSNYNDREMKTIDSLNMVRQQQEERLRRMREENEKENRERNIQSRHYSEGEELDALSRQMQLIQKMASGEKILSEEEKIQEQRRRELEMMKKHIIDSIAAANAPVEVNKVGEAYGNHFNTIEDGNSRPELIRGRVDELVKVKDGSRLRIRLSDDVEIEGTVIPKGTYVYANVTGFSAQRVKAQVRSMMVGNKITNVELNVYDLDCQEGFFVPASSFRELAKDIGSGAMNMNLNMNGTGEQSLESVAMQSLQQAFQATTSAISKNIRQNKAKIKYNTEVYLISK
uniref:conjugative transposon protein TraM n=1 Tax=Bacteroides fragilis TaxID=817 RepID=UPI0035634C1F